MQTLINGLKSDIARLEANCRIATSTSAKNHPQTQRSESELASLRDKLNRRNPEIMSSIGTSYQVGKQKEKELLEAIETQKTRVLDLNKQRDEINVLKRDVESALRAFEGVSQRSAQTAWRVLDPDNVVVLNPASEPTDPRNEDFPQHPRLDLPRYAAWCRRGTDAGTWQSPGPFGRRLGRSDRASVLASIASTQPATTMRGNLRRFFSRRTSRSRRSRFHRLNINRNQIMNLLEPSFHRKTGFIAATGNGRSIGAILIDTGRLSAENAERILRLQKEKGKRFGDCAIELGLLGEDDIRFAFPASLTILTCQPADKA